MMILDLINYLIAGVIGFVLGILVGSVWKEVHQIKEVVVDQNEETQPESGEPTHKRRWRILGIFVALVAIGQLAYTINDSQERNATTRCLAEYVADYSDVNAIRSKLAANDFAGELQNRRELLKIFIAIQSRQITPKELKAYSDYLQSSIAASERRQTRRENNPLPLLERRDCG